MSGWLVSVTTQKLGGGLPSTELYVVAVSEGVAAEEQIREMREVTPHDVVEVETAPTEDTLDRLGVQQGQIKCYSPGLKSLGAEAPRRKERWAGLAFPLSPGTRAPCYRPAQLTGTIEADHGGVEMRPSRD